MAYKGKADKKVGPDHGWSIWTVVEQNEKDIVSILKMRGWTMEPTMQLGQKRYPLSQVEWIAKKKRKEAEDLEERIRKVKQKVTPEEFREDLLAIEYLEQYSN